MKFLKQFSLYTFIGFFNAGISFLLMPYLSYFIDPAGYGILSMVNSLVTILIPLVGLTASGLISVEYYRMQDKSQFASLFSSVQLIPIIPGIIILLLSILFKEATASFLEIPVVNSYWIPFSVLIALLSIYFETLLVFNVIQQKPRLYVLFSLIKLIVEVGLTLFFVSGLELGWEGRLYSWFLTTSITFFIALYYFRNEHLLTIRIRRYYIRAGILFGLPLIHHSIGKFVINQSDRVFIAKMVSIEEAGIYNIGYQVGMVILLLVTAVGNFYQPFLFERLSHHTETAKLQIVRFTYVIIAGLLISLILLSIGSPLLFNTIIDNSYSKGVVYVFWTGLSYFLWGLYILFAGFIFYKKETGILGYLAVINVALNLILNYLLISKFGALGAVYATCISFFVIAIVVIWKGNSLYPLPWLKFRYILRSKSDPI